MKNVKVIDENTIKHKGNRYVRAAEGEFARKGDIVKRISNASSRYSVGKFYKIKGLSNQGDYDTKDDHGDLVHFSRHNGALFRKVPKQVSGEITQDTPKLKVGDFVIIDTSRFNCDITEGKAYEILEIRGSLYFVDDVGDERTFALQVGAYTIADTEEAKWASIGRKVNEYRKGDIVRIIDAFSEKHIEGSIGEVKYDRMHEAPLVVAPTTDGELEVYFAKVELIAPVKAVFK